MIGNHAKHIIFLQAAHTSDDDRVLYHQAQTLRDAGHVVEVYGMESFHDFVPKSVDIYIVDTPKALWKIRRLPVRVIYDITEWYPSKKNLRNVRFGKCVKAVILVLANLWAACRASAFIFGEEQKAMPFRWLFPRKKYIYLPYYPSLSYIQPMPVRDISSCCRVLYAGALTEEKGWFNVLDTMRQIADRMPQRQFQLDVITKDSWTDVVCPRNLQIRKHDFMSFEKFCQQITGYDLYFDLRKIDFENTRCLPIKLFYYMACGRPSIYSNLSAIPLGVPEINQCAMLVNNTAESVAALEKYLQDNVYYQQHCEKALLLSQKKYNWEAIQALFLQLISEL